MVDNRRGLAERVRDPNGVRRRLVAQLAWDCSGVTRRFDIGIDDGAASRNSRVWAEQLLGTWRRAERQLGEAIAAGHDVRQATVEVVTAWLSYQTALSAAPDELILVADDERELVAVSANAQPILGYAPDELRGRRVDDIVAETLAATVADRWAQFRASGREVDLIPLRAKDGTVVVFQYDARLDLPVPGYHVSRLKVAEGPRVEREASSS
jgi:PAS domain S-box-containing protein